MAEEEHLTVQDMQPIDGEVVEGEVEDVDIEQWLAGQAAEAGRIGYADIEGKRIKIAMVTEGEENKLLKASRRPVAGNRNNLKMDPLVYRREYVAFSLSKANGRTVFADSLVNLPPGVLTRLQQAINRLAKYEGAKQQDPFEYLS